MAQIKSYRREYYGSNADEISKFIERVSKDLFGKPPTGREFTADVLNKLMTNYGITGNTEILVSVMNGVMRITANLPITLTGSRLQNIKAIITNGRDLHLSISEIETGTSIRIKVDLPEQEE